MKRFCLSALVALGSVVVSENLVGAQQLASEDPIGEIAADMGGVVREISKLSTGKPTQDQQKAVVAKLDELIARLDKECAACRGGGASGANPQKPLPDSMVIGGPGGIGDLHAPRQLGKKWGELPPHQRDRILQSMSEGFPAHYQQILERYYRRLAEEKPASAAGVEGSGKAADQSARQNPPPAAPAPAPSGQSGAQK